MIRSLGKKPIFWVSTLLLCGKLSLAPAFPVSPCPELLLKTAAERSAWSTLRRTALWLHRQDPRRHQSAAVRAVASVLGFQKPADKIAAWVHYFELASQAEDSRQVLRADFLDAHVVRHNEIPESFFDRQRAIAKARGRSATLSQEQRDELAHTVVTDQRESLGAWFDYLTGKETQHYAPWARAFILTEVAKLSKFDQAPDRFPKRDRGQLSPFPELNHEALAHTFRALLDHANSERRDPFLFRETYARHLVAVQTARSDTAVVAGAWVRFARGSDPTALVAAIGGHGTDWCTAEIGTALAHLSVGDFHVFFSFDRELRPTIPRVAIRFIDDRIAEVRGVTKGQHLDPQIAETRIVDDKLATFRAEGARFKKYSEQSHRIALLVMKHRFGEAFTSSELRFLYELDEPVLGFGNGPDPRMVALRKARDMRKDIALAFGEGFTEADVSLTPTEALQGRKIHYGDLYLSGIVSMKGTVLPRFVFGNLNLWGLQSAEEVELPEIVRSDLNLGLVTSTAHLRLPREVHGDLNLERLTKRVNEGGAN